jgi:hypothetical protein
MKQTPKTKITTSPQWVRRKTYSIEEAARILGICRSVAYRPGVLPTVKVSGRLLVPKKALEGLLAGTTQTSDEAIKIRRGENGVEDKP